MADPYAEFGGNTTQDPYAEFGGVMTHVPAPVGDKIGATPLAEQTGALPALHRGMQVLTGMPSAVYHAVMDDARDANEDARATATSAAMGGNVPSRLAMVYNRLFIDPQIQAGQKADQFQNLSDQARSAGDHETADRLQHAANVHREGSFVPMIGPWSADIVDRRFGLSSGTPDPSAYLEAAPAMALPEATKAVGGPALEAAGNVAEAAKPYVVPLVRGGAKAANAATKTAIVAAGAHFGGTAGAILGKTIADVLPDFSTTYGLTPEAAASAPPGAPPEQFSFGQRGAGPVEGTPGVPAERTPAGVTLGGATTRAEAQPLAGDEIAVKYGYKNEQAAINDVGRAVWEQVKAQGRQAGRPVNAPPVVTEPPAAAQPTAAAPTPPPSATMPEPAEAEAPPAAAEKPSEAPAPGQRAPYVADDISKILASHSWQQTLRDHVDSVVPPDENPALNTRTQSQAAYYAEQGEPRQVAEVLNVARENARAAPEEPIPPEHAPWGITTGEVPATVAPEDIGFRFGNSITDSEATAMLRAAMAHEESGIEVEKGRTLARELGFGVAASKQQLEATAGAALKGEEAPVWTKLPNWTDARDTARVLSRDYTPPTDPSAIKRALSGADNTFITEERYQTAKKAFNKAISNMNVGVK